MQKRQVGDEPLRPVRLLDLDHGSPPGLIDQQTLHPIMTVLIVNSAASLNSL